jgi:hypothetical protein
VLRAQSNGDASWRPGPFPFLFDFVASYPATARTSRLLCTSLERMTQIRSCIERASRLDSQEERPAALEIDSLLARRRRAGASESGNECGRSLRHLKNQ